VSHHLNECAQCRKELSGLSAVRDKLKSLGGIRAPEYLRDLVQYRLADMNKNRWRVQVQDALERRWSLIRTTERIWYMTRVVGTIMAAVFFFLIPHAIDPLDIEAGASMPGRSVYTRAEKQQVALNVVAKLGMLPKEARQELAKPKQPAIKPAINDQYLSKFAQSISQDGNDYDFSVVTSVDRRGQAKIQNVLEHPNAQSFLDSFNKVISAGRFAPSRENGEAVPSYMLLIFSKISVSD
jgi:hypothetical protein